MDKEKIMNAAQTAVRGARAFLSVLTAPEVRAAIDVALEHSKKKTAEESAAGKAQKALDVITDPKTLLAAQVAFTLATQGAKLPPKP
jgi:hypothetical protein